MTSPRLDIQRLSGSLGATVTGVRLGAVVGDEALLGTVHRALAEHQVLFLPAQPIDIEALYAFAASFGELREIKVDGQGRPVDPPFPDHLALSLTSGDSRADEWHTDVTFMGPNVATVLQCRTSPPAGGDTVFASLTRAYEALSERMRAHIDGLVAEHSGALVGEPHKVQVHPVVRRHPVTGLPVLYVNRVYTTRILGVSPRESRFLLDYLIEHVEQAHFTCRWAWRPGDVTVWDNRSTCHVAVSDYGAEVPREMYHVAVKGDVPEAYHREVSA